MKILPDDPRITAYALGEIEDTQERQAIEAAIAGSPELQAAVDAIQSMSALLRGGLAAEVLPELSEFEKAKLEQAPNKRSHSAVLLAWPLITGVAAVLAVAAILIPRLIRPELQYAYEAAPVASHASESAPSAVQIVRQSPAILADAIDDESTDFEKREVADRDGFAASADQVLATEAAEPQAALASSEGMSDLDMVWAQPEGAAVARAPASAVATAPFVPPPPPPPTMRTTQRSMPRPASSSPENEAKTRREMLASVDTAWERSKAFEEKPTSRTTPTVPAATQREWNTERYDPIEESDFRSPLVAPLSTFSIDVDTASYANVRRFLNQGQLPPADAVRIEELINYFPYADAAPTQSLDEGGDPFAVHMAQTVAPWNAQHRLLRIALKGYEMPWEARPASNLVFLLDVSGSMNDRNKLPLVKEAMDILVQRLDQRDRVAIVVYAGASGLVLPSTTANNTQTIAHAIQNLHAGGSTNAGAGIELAYQVARENFIADGNNRVILCTDGDFNVGQTNRGDLAKIAAHEAQAGCGRGACGAAAAAGNRAVRCAGHARLARPHAGPASGQSDHG